MNYKGPTFIISSTQKSAVNLLEKMSSGITEEIRGKIRKMLNDVGLKAGVGLTLGVNIHFGERDSGVTYFISDPMDHVRRLESVDIKGSLPLYFFSILLEKPNLWADFEKTHDGGFYMTKIGSKDYEDLTMEEIKTILQKYSILKELKAHACQVMSETYKRLTCMP